MRKHNNPLLELHRSQEAEIQKYKWIESERLGRDIGSDRAAREWMQKHFPAWHRHSWKKSIEEALRRN